MNTIIRNNLTISGTYQLTSNTQVAAGVTITVMPGATLDLGGFNLHNFGTLSLKGNADSLAKLQNGYYKIDSTAGMLTSTYGHLDKVMALDYASGGALAFNKTLVEGSEINVPFGANVFNQSIFVNSSVNFYGSPATVRHVTFFNSPLSLTASSLLYPDIVTIADSNFIGTSDLIYLDPFGSGQGVGHTLKISNSYISIPKDRTFEDMVYDATDDLRVVNDFQASSFLTEPIINSKAGFVVGPYTLSINALKTGVIANSTPLSIMETHQVSVVVDKGVLSVDAVLLKGLTENTTYLDGILTSHTITYGDTVFEYEKIDHLITTVTRGDNFTNEFRREISDLAPTAAALTYADAVALVGLANIDRIVLHVAGADGNYVG